MPDLAAGTKVKGADTPPSVGEMETGSYTTTLSANYGVTGTGYPGDCGQPFKGPTSGRVLILYAAQMLNGTAASNTLVSPHIRTGSTVGSGTDVQVASDAEAIFNRGTDVRRIGAHTFLSGLTAGSDYNVRLEHKVTGGTTGTIANRRVTVIPCT